MQLQYFRPKNKLLSQYLEGYYFLEKERDEPTVEYFTFPNNFSIVSVITDAQIVMDDKGAFVEEKKEAAFLSTLICHYKKPFKVHYEGKIREVTFYFKPLGLNAFISKPLEHYLENSYSSFAPFEDYETTLKSILNENNKEEQRNQIEKYWLSKLIGFENPLIQDVLLELTENAEEASIEKLAVKHHTSRQNIARQFHIHVGKTPSEFRKIQRFRETMAKNTKLANKDKGKGTLSYDSSFYDQSHLIKDFKAFTGLAPKAFFKSVSLQENATINWLFL
ncbi:helix-turn-helix domain-containing protein [Flavobacterium microcysteis]|uniref:AraC family transcriptional regulator n=1 Tax=Flavobacterium microcysteis TaxID=2596891 RepID=A0A501Q2V5_9FLAO|nr:helix-turn-helix domain-containing protein [Flavobacterium microcysteis]TPD67210.1 AraC family transcriptional regulator [Flavobacterium microcysteis]